MKPYYYQDDWATIYFGDALEILPKLILPERGVVVTDPPYGISYKSGMTGHDGGIALPSIRGDDSVQLRDSVIFMFSNMPAIIFGTWKVKRPNNLKAVLTWEKGDHVGMGDLSLPWKPNTEEIYILGSGFNGHRGSSVLRHNAPVTWNSNGRRKHAHEKPISLMIDLIKKCPDGTILDPFMGVGTTLLAAKQLNRKSIGIEIEEKYCEIAARRLSQEVLDFSTAQ